MTGVCVCGVVWCVTVASVRADNRPSGLWHVHRSAPASGVHRTASDACGSHHRCGRCVAMPCACALHVLCVARGGFYGMIGDA